jgi:bifunctional DNase/RNase
MGRLSKLKWCLLGCFIIVLVLIAGAVFAPGRLISTITWVANSDSASNLRATSEQKTANDIAPIEMIVETVGITETNFQPVVVLKEKGGEAFLPIWIGPLEATAISVILEGVKPPRPLTPDLLCSIIYTMGASVDRIIINDFQDNIFYANIVINTNWIQMRIDARPSDAIAVALRVRAPIYVEKVILDNEGFQPGNQTGKYITMHTGNKGPG